MKLIDDGKTDPETTKNIEPYRAPMGSKKGLTRTSVQIEEDLMERLRNAVYWTPGASLNRVFLEGAEMLVDALEKQNGKPFPKRGSERLLTGRRYK